MQIRRVTLEDFDALLQLQLQLEAAEISFDDNLKEKCYQTDRVMEKRKNRIRDINNIFLCCYQQRG